MGFRVKNQKPLLDFQSKSDDSWYTIRTLLLDTYKQTLVLKYLDFTEESDECFSVNTFKTHEELDDFKKRFHPACVQLQDKECKDVKKMMEVCCSLIQGDEGEDLKFYNGVIDSDTDGLYLKKTAKDPSLGGTSLPAKSLTKEGYNYYIVIENLEKDLNPWAILSFLFEHVSIICGAFVYPSLSSDANTRGIITVDTRGKFQMLLKYLCDPAILIVSSRGRPWVITDVKPRGETFGCLMPETEIIQGFGLTVVRRGTEEYKTGKQLIKLFRVFAKSAQGLHGNLSLAEKDIFRRSNTTNRKKRKVAP